MKCCICGMEIDQENRSEEHIIHNAIGGILKSDSIYCKKCNSKYGSDLDKAFTDVYKRQLMWGASWIFWRSCKGLAPPCL